MMLDLRNHTLSLPQDKVDKIVAKCNECSNETFMSRRSLEQLVGLLNFAAACIPLGRFYLPVIRWMNSHTSAGSRDLQVPLDAELKDMLLPWLGPSFLGRSVPMHVPIPSLEIMTDASLHGWCGLLLPHRVEGVWSHELSGHSMNWMELKAIHFTILQFAGRLRGRFVRVLSNTTALAIICSMP